MSQRGGYADVETALQTVAALGASAVRMKSKTSVCRSRFGRATSSAGAGPGADPLTIDLDSTVCETYGLGKEGAQRHNYAGKRGRYSITVRQHPRLRNLIRAVPVEGWTPPTPDASGS